MSRFARPAPPSPSDESLNDLAQLLSSRDSEPDSRWFTLNFGIDAWCARHRMDARDPERLLAFRIGAVAAAITGAALVALAYDFVFRRPKRVVLVGTSSLWLFWLLFLFEESRGFVFYFDILVSFFETVLPRVNKVAASPNLLLIDICRFNPSSLSSS